MATSGERLRNLEPSYVRHIGGLKTSSPGVIYRYDLRHGPQSVFAIEDRCRSILSLQPRYPTTRRKAARRLSAAVPSRAIGLEQSHRFLSEPIAGRLGRPRKGEFWKTQPFETA